ncbi:MAG: hypothetical protein R3D31_13875 [Hyphomicrobiaceae bacterium]
MLAGLVAWLEALKSQYGLIYDLAKLAIAIGSAVGIVKAINAARGRNLKSEEDGRRAELASLDGQCAGLARRAARAKRWLSHIEAARDAVQARTPEAALAAAEREFQQGNYETSADLLGRWLDGEARHVAFAAESLAQWHERLAAEGKGGTESAALAARCASIARLAAPAPPAGPASPEAGP